MNKDPNIHEDFVAAEDISHHDQEMGDLLDDNLSYAFDIVSNASTVLGCPEDLIFPVKDLKSDDQIDRLANDSLESATKTISSLQFPDCSKYDEDEGEQKGLYQQFMMHVSLSDVEQPALYEFQDPIVTYMEKFCSEKISVVVIFKVTCLDCKSDFKDYVSHVTVWMSVTFHKVGIQLLSWLHWKFDFT